MNMKVNLLNIAAESEVSVLLQGESGCGKEVAARWIHRRSARASGPFVAVNCGAIATNLAESVLEGARKGAYTGAATDQTGVVRAASGGTLFLDEIGEMPLELQCKLLRILQEKSVMPLGSTQSIPVDFRLVCATNRDLRTEVAAGRFREDLYFRLNVFPIRLPPLRERQDFEDLAQEIWAEIAPRRSMGTLQPHTPTPLTAQEIGELRQQKWPGNVRQLKNVLQRYALLQVHHYSLRQILDEEFPTSATPKSLQLRETARSYSAAPRRELILQALQGNHWNRSLTAKKLGISRGALCYQIKKHHLEGGA